VVRRNFEGRPTGRTHTGRVPALLATLLLIVALMPSAHRVAAGGPNTWTRIGSMTVPRSAFTATLLPNGQVLVAGGGFRGLATAELYDLCTGRWTATGSMSVARAGHTATLLTNGMVLVAGGDSANGGTSAELYDPRSGRWTRTGSMHEARRYHTATLLPSGQVLVAGGGNSLALQARYNQ
jgi:hypothetical protein